VVGVAAGASVGVGAGAQAATTIEASITNANKRFTRLCIISSFEISIVWTTRSF